ncbi:MAG: alpha-glucosidase, partial [Muribaculaceae bacterium]|nr:alpha-glucosidase [Muribaculaceae bacterium]
MNFKRVLTMALILGSSMGYAFADQSFMTDNGVAVFYPSGYEAAQHEPSPIFVNELKSVGDVSTEWNLRPEFSTSDGKSIVRIPVGEGVDFYGNGEVAGPLRRNGKEVRFWNTDAPKYEADEGRRLYQSHPWVMGVRPDGTAFGVIADNTWKSSVTMDEDIVFESEGPAFRVVVIEKESPDEVLKALTDLTGHIEMPPLWALGYQQCRWSYFPDTRVKEIADSLRINKIPSDVIWM